MELYPNDLSTEQRICDQRAQIIRRADSNNIGRGNWLTSFEVNEIKDQISREVADEDKVEGENEPIHRQQQQQQHQNIETDTPEPQHDPEPTQEDHQPDEIEQQLMNEYAKSILTTFGERKFIKRPGRKDERELEKSVEKVNKTLEAMPLLTEISDVTCLNNLVYASAIAAIKIADLEKQCLPVNKRQQKKEEWHVSFKRRIDNIRTEINKIMQITNVNESAKMKRNSNSLKNKYKIDSEEKRQTTLEILRQKLKALNNRLSRYLKREKQFKQNKDFLDKPSKLFDELRGNRITIELKKKKLSSSGDHFSKRKNYTTNMRHGSQNISPQQTTSFQQVTPPSQKAK